MKKLNTDYNKKGTLINDKKRTLIKRMLRMTTDYNKKGTQLVPINREIRRMILMNTDF